MGRNGKRLGEVGRNEKRLGEVGRNRENSSAKESRRTTSTHSVAALVDCLELLGDVSVVAHRHDLVLHGVVLEKRLHAGRKETGRRG